MACSNFMKKTFVSDFKMAELVKVFSVENPPLCGIIIVNCHKSTGLFNIALASLPKVITC